MGVQLVGDVVADVMRELEGMRLPHQQLAGAELMGNRLVERQGDLVVALVPLVKQELLPEFEAAMAMAKGGDEAKVPKGGPLLTVKEVAVELGVTENSVRRWVAKWPQVRFRTGTGGRQGRYRVRFGLLRELFEGEPRDA
jgi:hypothetical protein